MKIILFLASLFAFIPVVSMAAGLPDYYPSTFHRTGVINQMDTIAEKIMIDGLNYPYAIDVKVHSLNNIRTTISAIKVNQKIGAKFNNSNKKIIKEIWILSDDYPLQRR